MLRCDRIDPAPAGFARMTPARASRERVGEQLRTEQASEREQGENGEGLGMTRLKIKRAAALSALALAAVAMALPLASQAATAPPTQPGPPLVTTGGVSHVSGTSATLEGTVDPHGYPTTYYFQYGPTSAYGAQTTPASLPTGTAKVKVSQAVTGLLTGYHYRLVATNAAGTKNGHDHVFTPKNSKKSGFVLPKTYLPIPLGGTFILDGTLNGAGNANRPVVLEASPYPYRAAFTPVGSAILTTATGHFSFRVANLQSSTKYRVSTVAPVPLHSLIIPQPVSVRVTLKVKSSSHKGLVRLYGTVTPAEVGARVFFELERPPKSEEKAPKGEQPGRLENPKKNKSNRAEEKEKGPTFAAKFDTIVKPATRSISRFSAVVSIRQAGNYRAFVEVRSGPLASGHSANVVLHAVPGKKKKGKKKTT
jgi:hypothetical protein